MVVQDGRVVVGEISCVHEQVGEVGSSCLHAGKVTLRVLGGLLGRCAHVVTGVVGELHGGLGEAVVEAEHLGRRARLALDHRCGCCGGLVAYCRRGRGVALVSYEDLPELLGGQTHVVAPTGQFRGVRVAFEHDREVRHLGQHGAEDVLCPFHRGH